MLLEREQARREAAKAERERTRIEWSDLEVGVVLARPRPTLAPMSTPPREASRFVSLFKPILFEVKPVPNT